MAHGEEDKGDLEGAMIRSSACVVAAAGTGERIRRWTGRGIARGIPTTGNFIARESLLCARGTGRGERIREMASEAGLLSMTSELHSFLF